MSQKVVGNRRKRLPSLKREVEDQLTEARQDIADFNREMAAIFDDGDEEPRPRKKNRSFPRG
jgi:hypothetical protein